MINIDQYSFEFIYTSTNKLIHIDLLYINILKIVININITTKEPVRMSQPLPDENRMLES